MIGPGLLRQGKEHDRADPEDKGDREDAVGNAKRFELDRSITFIPVFRRSEKQAGEVKSNLENDGNDGRGDKQAKDGPGGEDPMGEEPVKVEEIRHEDHE